MLRSLTSKFLQKVQVRYTNRCPRSCSHSFTRRLTETKTAHDQRLTQAFRVVFEHMVFTGSLRPVSKEFVKGNEENLD